MRRIVVVVVCFVIFASVGWSRVAASSWLLDSEGNLIYWDVAGRVLGRKVGKPLPVAVNEKASGLFVTPELDQSEDGEAGEPAVNEVKTVGKPGWVIIKNNNRKLSVTVLDEEGEEVDVPGKTDSVEFEIEEPEDKNTIKVRSTSSAVLVIRNRMAARTSFPIMVNAETGELWINTPNKGLRVVAVLPDAAIANMLAANVLDVLGGKGGIAWQEYQASLEEPSGATGSGEPPDATDSGEPSDATESAEMPPDVEEMVELTIDDEGTLVYEIEGIKYEKVLGLFPVGLRRKVIVSAETGELIAVKQNLPTRLLDLISF